MAGYAVTRGATYTTFVPRTPRAGKRGVILCHGAGAGNEYLDATGQVSSVRLAAAIAAAGIACIAGLMDGDTWANDTAMTDVDNAWTSLQSTAGVASDKVCVIGVSMGGAVALRWAMTRAGKAACVVGIIPASDISDIYTNNRGTYQASIATAWGVTAPAALPAGANLPAQAVAGAFPYQAYYSSADMIVIPSTVTTLATALGGTATIVDTTAGHSDATVGKVDIPTVVQYLVRNGA